MNKYQEELETLTKTAGFTSSILQELVSKATPKKTIVDYAGEFMEVNQYYCPTCKEYLDNVEGDFKYCPKCGQALDWSEE